ncbi:hypothetical protein Tco_1206989 [Tanacetum coccineum]
MLVNWRWRFNSETNSLWKNTISSIYGVRGGLGLEAQPQCRLMSTPWNSIIGLRKSLLRLNINLDSVFVRKVGNGASVKFWEETWYGNAPFKDVYLRLYALESSKSCNINERLSAHLRYYKLPTSRICLFIKGKKHGRMMLYSIDNGPLVYPTVEENGQTIHMKYSKLTKAQQLQDDCDVQATNIILHGLPPGVYAFVNHQEAAKDIWDRVKLLMKGTELSYQERECRLYNLFDKFAYVQGETMYEYYWRFSQLINTKLLNAFPPE